MTHSALNLDGPVFSRIIAGAWRWTLPVPEVETLIHRALDAGMTTFDHADIYGDHENEELFGNVLERTPSLRSRMQLITKCGIMTVSKRRPATRIKHYDTSREHIVWATENSLRLFHTDHIDLLLIHRPDPLLNPHEVAEAFTALRDAGKVLHFGVSNFTTAQFDMLQHYLKFPLVTNQLEISLTHQEPLFDGTVDNLMKQGVAPMAWSPLGGGKLVTGPMDRLRDIANKYQATPTQLLLAWLLRHPANIFPVIGTTKPERIKEAADALNVRLDRQDWYDMWTAGSGKPVP
jgi:predicted oxidoreductase